MHAPPDYSHNNDFSYNFNQIWFPGSISKISNNIYHSENL